MARNRIKHFFGRMKKKIVEGMRKLVSSFVSNINMYSIKYNLKDTLSGIALLFSGYLFILAKVYTIIPGIVIVLVVFNLAKDKIIEFLKGFLLAISLIVATLITTSWWNESTITLLNYSFQIDGSKMLVIITAVYVFLTFLILKSNKDQFGLARLPILKVNRIYFSFVFENKGEHIAKDVMARIKIIYPLPKGAIQSFLSYLKSSGEEFEFKLEEIFPHEKGEIDFEKEAIEFLQLKVECTDYEEKEFKAKGDKKELQFNVKLYLYYKSDTEYILPKDIERLYKLEVKDSRLELRKEGENEFKAKRIR